MRTLIIALAAALMLAGCQNKELTTCRTSLAECQETLKAKEQMLEMSTQGAQENEKQIVKLQQEKDQALADQKEMRSKMEVVMNTNLRQGQQLKANQARLAELENQLQTAKVAAGELDKANARNQELENQISALGKQVSELKAQLEKAQAAPAASSRPAPPAAPVPAVPAPAPSTPAR